MNSVLRRFMLKKGKKESNARQKLKKELFAYTRGLNLGFPSKPTSFDYDPVLSLIVIGTKTGDIRICGAPGIELYAQHLNGTPVTQVCFLIGQARLVTLCSDDSINLWEADLNTNLTSLKCVKSLTAPERFEELFRCCVFCNGNSLLVMNKNSFMIELDVIKFTASEDGQVPLSTILTGIPADLTSNIGRVVSFILQPSSADKFLIGYSSGLIVLWDQSSKKSIRYFNANQLMESLSFSPDGLEFVSSHFDGSYIVWSIENSLRPKDQPACPYGPFPCNAIHSIKWRPIKSDTYLIFSGGMPRASHSDKNTVTVMNNSSDHVVFELSSRVVDFVVMVTNDDDHGDSSAEEEALSLLILAEEEFVAIDLLSPDWPSYELPYLQNIQPSPIMCSEYCCDVYPFVIDALVENANFKIRSCPKISSRDWPVTGGRNLNKQVDSYKLLLFGHEDGSIGFFCPIRTGMKQIYKLNSARYFLLPGSANAGSKSKSMNCDDDVCSNKRCFDEFDEWPPFRKVGTYDPLVDDPQLGIRHILLSRHGELLIAAGTSGQILVFEFFKKEKGAKDQIDVTMATVNIVEENSGYSWVGHEPLIFNPAKSRLNSDAGYQLMMVIQVLPPVEPTCICLEEETGLLSVGTVYGYSLFDLLHNKVIMTKRTLTPQGSSRFLFKGSSKSLRKSFRDSFRKLKRKRGGGVAGSQRPTSSSGVQCGSQEGCQPGGGGVSGDDGQRCGGSVMSRSSETSPSTSKSHPTGSSSSHTLPIFPSSSHPCKRSNSETRSNPELTEGRSEDDDEDTEDADDRSRSRHSRRSTPSRSVTTPNTQKLVRPKRLGTFKKIAGGCQVEEPKITEVSCLSFAKTFLTAGQLPVLTLWVGTNVGSVFVHQLEVPAEEKRIADGVSCCLAKEINFKRRYPIVYLSVLSRSMRPLNRTSEGSEGDPEVEGHSVIIVTQGQLKLFSLPSLKMTAKYNFIGTPESPRICKADVVSFVSKSDENYVEHDLVCLASHDHLIIFNFPQLKTQLRINNLQFGSSMAPLSIISRFGEIFLFNSPSELHHLSLSTHSATQNCCTIELKPSFSRTPVQPLDGESRGPDSTAGLGNRDDMFDEMSTPHVVVSEHLSEGSGSNHGNADTRLTGPLPSSPHSTEFQGQQLLVSFESESELTTLVGNSGSIPTRTPIMVRSVTSSRTVMSRSTVSRSVNGEIITETSTDLERINIGVPLGGHSGLESDV